MLLTFAFSMAVYERPLSNAGKVPLNGYMWIFLVEAFLNERSSAYGRQAISSQRLSMGLSGRAHR